MRTLTHTDRAKRATAERKREKRRENHSVLTLCYRKRSRLCPFRCDYLGCTQANIGIWLPLTIRYSLVWLARIHACVQNRPIRFYNFLLVLRSSFSISTASPIRIVWVYGLASPLARIIFGVR